MREFGLLRSEALREVVQMQVDLKHAASLDELADVVDAGAGRLSWLADRIDQEQAERARICKEDEHDEN